MVPEVSLAVTMVARVRLFAILGGMNMKSILNLKSAVFAMVLVAGAVHSLAAETTALELIREGNRYVGEQFKDKVVMIRSEKSVATRTPQAWLINYRNDLTSLKGIEVKFIGGKMADVDGSVRGGKPFELSKIKIDSDQVLNVVTNEAILKNLTLRSTKMSLERLGEIGTPAWRVQLWAAKLRSPADSTSIGEIFLSAEDGSVLKNELKISRVD